MNVPEEIEVMLFDSKVIVIDACAAYDLIRPKGIEVILFTPNWMLNEPALGKSKAPGEMARI